MKFVAKSFSELSGCEVYEILKARAKVFMFEQKIWYLDMDNIDYRSQHLFLEENGEVLAYLRAFLEENSEVIHIGRVLSVEHNKGLGASLMNNAVSYFKQNGVKSIVLNSQKTAVGFYEKLGFIAVGEEFIEAGIPHIKMVKSL
ncbi:MAG: GNAT family N-acetyltransferase [Ruminococcaceae bacterium]|nr:GNAT family N-acetyltransferase [Oscillospiraceae bacterium]